MVVHTEALRNTIPEMLGSCHGINLDPCSRCSNWQIEKRNGIMRNKNDTSSYENPKKIIAYNSFIDYIFNATTLPANDVW